MITIILHTKKTKKVYKFGGKKGGDDAFEFTDADLADNTQVGSELPSVEQKNDEVISDEPFEIQNINENLGEIQMEPLDISLDDFVETKKDVNVRFYPEDKISEVKQKINLALKIPIFRQHLCKLVNGKYIPCEYKFTIDGKFIPLDSFQVFAESETNIFEMPIDLSYYKNKESIKIEAYDTFTLLGDTTEFHLIDLETFIEPYREQLINTVKSDKYTLQLLFYGFILPYWPIMDLSIFVEYINLKSISNSYPSIDPPISNLMFLVQQMDISDKIKISKSSLISSLTESTVKITSIHRQKIINLRILFDLLECTPVINGIAIYDIWENKHIVLSKYHKDYEPLAEKMSQMMMFFRITVDNQKLKLYIFPNGAYAIKGSWNEDQQLDFQSIIKIVELYINPIIDKINSLKSVLYYDFKLEKATKKNIKFIDLGISLFLKKMLSDSDFSNLKSLLKKFSDARIIQDKQLDKNVLEYYFKKGIYDLEAQRIEKTTPLDNYYSFMFNGEIRQKWFILFENIRILKITHRFSDLKIEISGIKENEYEIFNKYINYLIDEFLKLNSKKGNLDEDIKKISKKPLNSLKEHDPMLYNFKKLYNSEIVYSKICQKPFQPIILSQSQYKDLKDKKNITQYWNFTTESPAYYKCPNDKFPNIHFITGKHPKGYCIPCCKITLPSTNPEDKQRKIYETCLNKHIYEKKDVEVSSSRYIMSYGKPIDINRLSLLPEASMEPLFETSKKFYLFGVSQNLNSLQKIGAWFCLMHSLNYSEKQLIDAIVDKLPQNYNFLLKSEISSWFSQTELIHELNDVFIHGKPSEFDRWNDLAIDIAKYCLGINFIIFEDKHGSIQLKVPINLTDIDDLIDGNPYLIVLYNIETKNWNPVYQIYKDVYFRTGTIDNRLFDPKSETIQTIMDIYSSKIKQNVSNFLTLQIIKKFTEIEKLYVTTGNFCYGVHVKNIGFVPVHLSNFKSKDVVFSIKETELPTVDNLQKWFSKYNNWVAVESETHGFVKENSHKLPLLERIEPMYPLLKVEKQLVLDGTCIGFISNGLNFYTKHFKPIKDIPQQTLFCNFLKINEILESDKEPVDDFRTKEINNALYNKYSYRLLILEFIQYFNTFRNVKMRESIKKLIKSGEINEKLKETVVGNYKNSTVLNEDVVKIQSQITADKEKSLDAIENNIYNFDKMIIENIKILPFEQAKKQLEKIAEHFVTLGTPKVKEFSNILKINGKITLTKSTFDLYISIIADQLKNPFLGKYLFNPIYQNNMINYFNFNKYNNEIIQIEIIQD